MSFTTRTQFTTAQTSEKIVLAHIHATKRLITWVLDTGTIYKRAVSNFPVELKQDQTELTKVSTYGALVEGSFYYDPVTSELFVWCAGSVNPSNQEMIVTFRFFYSNAPVTASWDLTVGGEHVYYDARISSSPGYKHKVGIEQGLISLTGSGDLVLENNDGGLDDLVDTVFFENQDAFVYSWNKELPFDESQIIYRGIVTNKKYSASRLSLTIRDQIFELKQQIPQSTFSDEPQVQDNVKEQLKRIVYGRVDGLRLQSISQISDGYILTGLVSSNGTPTITGVGTLFLSEVSPDDTITVDGVEFDVESIQSDTELTIGDDPGFAFSGKQATIIPDIPTPQTNRTFFVTGHAGSTLTKTLVAIVQSNRVQLNNLDNLYVGDFLEFDTGERLQIKTLAPNNIAVLQQSLIAIPAISSDVVRQPVQSVYVSGKDLEASQYTITNLGAPDNKLTITLADDVEFNIAPARRLNIDMTFTNGSRDVTTIDDVDLKTVLKPRDWVRPTAITYSTYYEVLSVDTQSLELRVVFADPTITGNVRAKLPEYIGDDTVVSADVIGRTDDGEPNGLWLQTASQCVQSIIESIGITNINQPTFDEVNDTIRHLVSLALPLQPGGRLTEAKTAIDLINQSVFAALTLDNNLNLQYRAMYNETSDTPIVLTDFDVIDWDIQTTSGKTFRNSIIRYRHKDVDNLTLEETNAVEEHSSNFVRDYIGTDKTSEVNVYLYEETSARIMSHRYVYFNRLGRSDITIQGDLRLETIAIGDTIQLEFNRLYKRFGDASTRKKLVIVTGLQKTGTRITLECSDLGNTFNSSAIITPNDTNDYVDASINEKLKYGFITDSRGIVNNDEETANINLIS